MAPEQEPKYTTNVEGNLVNRATGIAIPDDEPVFILRAKDKHALSTLVHYRDMCSDSEHRAAVAQRIGDFAYFASRHPDVLKEPDTRAPF